MESKTKISTKIISISIFSLLLYSILIGFVNYNTAKDALIEKGKIGLKNSVILASEYIESQHDLVIAGVISEEAAFEIIKTTLLGPLNPDGTRTLHNKIDLGQNGYFIIYNQFGYEIMHPTLEGQYVFDVVDFSSEQKLLVQDQIAKAINGGGYTYYTWNFPHSKKIGEKVSYVQYEPNWDWIIVATTYEEDFTNEANAIWINVIKYSFGIVLILSLILSFIIKKITNPIQSIAKGMNGIAGGNYNLISPQKSSKEIKLLIDGYNQMIKAIITSKKVVDEKNYELEKLAYYDQLTNLPNRMSIKKTMTKILKNNKQDGIFILVDIANLQTINSTLGYQQGDDTIKILSKFLYQLKSKNTIVARSGSNEFAIWMSNIKEEIAYLEVNNLINELKSNFKLEGSKLYIDIHTVYLFHNYTNEESFESIYEKVSTAMHMAKKENDFTIHCYNDSMKDKLEYEISMRSFINNGINKKEFIPYYQKQVDYRSQKVLGFEALARWFSPEMGFIPPNVFIPFITKFNKESEFTDLFIGQVFSDFNILKEIYGKDITISINVSPTYFLAKGFKNKMASFIDQYNISPENIIIEITEDVIISDTKYAAEIVNSLHEIGLRVSIDDFGSGYSSLNYLLMLNPDEIKIDKSIVDQILTSDKSFYLFNTVCELAETFGYHIVAEGVETKSQIEKIKETSLTTIQGYYYSKPQSLESLTRK